MRKAEGLKGLQDMGTPAGQAGRTAELVRYGAADIEFPTLQSICLVPVRPAA
jgi:hypothetical protein